MSLTSVIGTPFYVMEYLRGRIFSTAIPENMSAAQVSEIYDSLNDVMQKIHSVDIKKAGLEDYGKTGNNYLFYLFLICIVITLLFRRS